MTTQSQETLNDEDLLFAGAVRETFRGRTILIFPIGVRHLSRFNRVISKLAGAILSLPLPVGTEPTFANKLAAARSKEAILTLNPMFADDLIDLVDSCTTPPIKSLNASFGITAQIIGRWLEVNLSENEIRPLVGAIENLTQRMTGQKLDLWDSLKSLPGSQQQDIPAA